MPILRRKTEARPPEPAALAQTAPPGGARNLIVITFDSLRYDTWTAAQPQTLKRLGAVERRWSYASWTAPSHYNLLSGLLPHSSPANVFASDYYKRDFLEYSERLGADGIEFKSLIPRLYFPAFLRDTLGYRTNALVSLPVLNPKTILNNGFDTYKLMEKHNDMRAMVRELTFSDRQPSFYLMNVGETHYPYALPDEPKDQWPRISGVHGVFKHLDDEVVGGKLLVRSKEKFFNNKKLKELRDRQVEAVKHLDGVVEELFDKVLRTLT